MTKQNLTEIICIVDRSGSMEVIRDHAIGGFNAFLHEQQALPGDASLTLVLFDDQYDVVVDRVDIQQVPPLDQKTFVPRGATALLDAMGRTIDAVGDRLAGTPEPERPGQVIIVTLTDGEENSSRHYSRHDVFDRVAHQRDTYGWEFLFLAANQDAIAAAAALAIDAGHAVNFAANAQGTAIAFATASAAVGASRMALFGSKKKKGGTVN